MQKKFSAAGQRIAELRSKLTQAAFAEKLGVDRKTVVHWEAGERLPDGASLLKLTEVFGADVNYILTGQRSVPVSETLNASELDLLQNYRQSLPGHRRVIENVASLASNAPVRTLAA